MTSSAYVRPPSVGDSWTIEQWTEYRDRHIAACERWPTWAENVGNACVRMAERRIEKLSHVEALSS